MHVVGNELSVLHVVSYLMNSIAVGFSISSFYIYIEQIIEFSDYITVSVIGILATVVLFSATSHKASKAYKKGMIIVFIIASFILTLVLWFTHHQPIYSLLFFYMIILNFYIGFSLVEANHIKDWLKHNSLASFGYFMVVSTLILIVISEGQILEGLDGLGYIGSGKQKDQQRS